MTAVVVAWLAGALGGLAVVPYAALPFVFVAVVVLPTLVTFWDSDGLWKRHYGPRRRWQVSPVPSDRAAYASGAALTEMVMTRYRALWLIGPIALGAFAAMINMFGGFASIVVTLDGERVQATLLQVERTPHLRDSGYDVGCVLARPDGARIPGALRMPDEDDCGRTEDVIVDRHGLVNPLREQDGPGALAGADAFLLGLALVSCLPAAWPKREDQPRIRRRPSPKPTGPDGAAARQRRRHNHLRRKRRMRA